MKKLFVVFAFVAALGMTACGGGKPSYDDAKGIAKYQCDKMKEMMGLMKDPVANAKKIEAIGTEMEGFEKGFKEHHGDKSEEMQTKVQEELKTVCADLAGGM
jgi:hypothetical protein